MFLQIKNYHIYIKQFLNRPTVFIALKNFEYY